MFQDIILHPTAPPSVRGYEKFGIFYDDISERFRNYLERFQCDSEEDELRLLKYIRSWRVSEREKKQFVVVIFKQIYTVFSEAGIKAFVKLRDSGTKQAYDETARIYQRIHGLHFDTLFNYIQEFVVQDRDVELELEPPTYDYNDFEERPFVLDFKPDGFEGIVLTPGWKEIVEWYWKKLKIEYLENFTKQLPFPQ